MCIKQYGAYCKNKYFFNYQFLQVHQHEDYEGLNYIGATKISNAIKNVNTS